MVGRVIRVAEGDAVEGDVELTIDIAAPAALRIAHRAIGVVGQKTGGRLDGLVVIGADWHDVAQDLVADDGAGLRRGQGALRESERRGAARRSMAADGCVAGDRDGHRRGGLSRLALGVGAGGARRLLHLLAGGGLGAAGDGHGAQILALRVGPVRQVIHGERKSDGHHQGGAKKTKTRHIVQPQLLRTGALAIHIFLSLCDAFLEMNISPVATRRKSSPPEKVDAHIQTSGLPFYSLIPGNKKGDGIDPPPLG